jgi:hypothetical protein
MPTTGSMSMIGLGAERGHGSRFNAFNFKCRLPSADRLQRPRRRTRDELLLGLA